jgi:ankyrin repeat protein
MLNRFLLRPLWRAVAGALAVFGVLGCVMGKYSPEEFFTGRALEAARTIESGDIDGLRLQAKELDVNAPGRKGMTLLWFAIQEQNFEAIKALVELGSTPDEQIVEGVGSAVDYAMYNKNVRFLEAMLDGGLPVDLRRNGSKTLLHRAAGTDGATLEHTVLLVERGADVNARSKINGTPLDEAISAMRPDIAKYLVEQGADVSAFKTNGDSVAWGVQFVIDRQQPGSEMRRKFENLRDLMAEKGAKFPADPPAKVREWAKSQGMKVAE